MENAVSAKGKLTYIGSFPPPYGGVTVKNALLYKHLSARLDIDRIDLSRVKKLEPKLLFGLARSLISRKGAIVDDRNYIERMNGFKHVYVETESMRKAFEDMGAWNVSVYPNCRERPAVPVKIKPSGGGVLDSVFFSLISPDKGIELIFGASDMVPDVGFHLYGRIEEGYEARFSAELAKRNNVWYHGVFDSVEGDVVSELNKYDVHLFPTLCPNEGVPGVIAETKMAAVPTIASDRGYNSELIDDGIDGALTHEESSEELARILSDFSTSSCKVDAMKAAALESAESYYIDRYIDWIASDLIA